MSTPDVAHSPHPTPSGAKCVPSLVLLAPSHRVGSCHCVLVTRGLGAAGGTGVGVMLAATMATSPTVIPRERFVLGRTKCSRRARRGCQGFSQSLRELLVGLGEHGHGV